MTNSLIPYSFIPGTKAKAQEVNANFIALADRIVENKEYTDAKIDATISTVNNDRAGTKLENTTLISNCIIDAPNGIVTYTGNTITVKSGLKVLIPDGRTDDGTYKSIEHTVEADVLLTTVKNTTVNCVYVTQETVGIASGFQESYTTPILASGIWHNPLENKNYIYNTDSSSWQEFQGIVIATYENSADAVTKVKPINTIGLLKENDVLSILAYSYPDYASTVAKTAGTTYTATLNGYLYAFAETQQNQYKYLTVEGKTFAIGYHISGQIGWSALFMPIQRGAKYSVSSGNCKISFIPMKGEL